MLLAKSRSFDAIQCPDLPLPSTPSPLPSPLSPLPSPVRLFSLYNNGAMLFYPRCHHPRQLFAAEGKRVSTDFARTPFKGMTFHTLARFLSTLPFARPANRSRNDDRNQLLCTPLALRMCAGEFMRTATGRVCVHVYAVCTCMHANAYTCVHLCAWREP